MKKLFAIGTVILFAVGIYFYYQLPKQKTNQQAKVDLPSTGPSKTKQPTSDKKQIIESKNSKIMRSRKIASAPKDSVLLKFQNRNVIGNFNKDLKDLPITNKINDNWKDITYSNINDQLSLSPNANYKLSIKEIKPVVYIKHGIGQYAEHIMVSIQKDNKRSRTYEALVDSETGTVIQTWNKTRPERRESVKVSIEGRGFAGTSL